MPAPTASSSRGSAGAGDPPWLFRIAHNECISILRRRPAHPTQPLTGLEVLPGQGVAEQIEITQELGRLRQDLLALPDEQRAALVLRELSGFSHAADRARSWIRHRRA